MGLYENSLLVMLLPAVKSSVRGYCGGGLWIAACSTSAGRSRIALMAGPPDPGRKWTILSLRVRWIEPNLVLGTTVYLSTQIQETSAAHLRREAMAWSIAPQLM